MNRWPDEPDARNEHVRICGSPGWVTAQGDPATYTGLLARVDVTGERNIASQIAFGVSDLRAQSRVLDQSTNQPRGEKPAAVYGCSMLRARILEFLIAANNPAP